MVDRFPEAFRRYEKTVDTKGMKGFKQLLISFSLWGQKKTPMTKKQIKGLAIEAKKIDIKAYMDERGFRNKATGRFEKTPTKESVSYIRYRDPLTGRFMKKPEYL